MKHTNEIIERLENLAKHAVHRVGEPRFVMSLDDGIALHEAIDLLKERQWRKFVFREPDADEKESHSEWIKVLIDGPDDGDEILVSDGKYVWKDEFHVDDTCYLDSDADLEECWWTPLPEPPKENEDDDE